MFSHEQAVAFPPPKVSWCSLYTAIFPQEMSSDVKATFCHSFQFAVATEQQADIDEPYLSCAHTSEGPPKWSPQWIPLLAETRPVWWQVEHDGDAQVMGPNYILHNIFSSGKMDFFIFSCPFPCVCSVNVSTCMWFPGHSQVLKVNTSFTSSRTLTSIIKAVSRPICFILSIRSRPDSSGAGNAERTELMKLEVRTLTQPQPNRKDLTGELPHTGVLVFFLYKLIC